MYEHLLFTISDGICRVTLNRPHVHNALNPALIREITHAMEAAGADKTVRVVVLTGAGDKAFCSGADLKEAAGQLQNDSGFSMGELLRTTYHPMVHAIRNLPKPVVCRLNGVAAGAGCSLALACDVLIAANESYLSLLFVGIGLMPDAGSTFFLPRLVGSQKAFELASTGRRVYGPEAAQLGLVTRSVPTTDLDAAVSETVGYYVTAPTQAIGLMKLALNQSLYSNLETQLEQEAQYQNKLGQSRDATEGITAFLTKRNPAFTGK